MGRDAFVGVRAGCGQRHHDTFQTQVDEPAGQDESGGAGLVADLEPLEIHPELLGELAQGGLGGGIAAPAGSVVGGILAIPLLGVGNRDGIFMDVAPGDGVEAFGNLPVGPEVLCPRTIRSPPPTIPLFPRAESIDDSRITQNLLLP